MTEKNSPVLVTTKHRGVFFGYFDSQEGNVVTLRDARNALYWSAECKGFLGLATVGPIGNSRVGPRVESITLHDVASVSVVSKEAVKVWESQPWSA